MTRKKEEMQFYYSAPWIYNRKIEEIHTVIERVAWLLHRNSHLRNCDKCLIRAYEIQVDKYHGELDHAKIHSITPAESITRARRKLQENGVFMPQEEVRQAREISRQAMEDIMVEQ